MEILVYFLNHHQNIHFSIDNFLVTFKSFFTINLKKKDFLLRHLYHLLMQNFVSRKMPVNIGMEINCIRLKKLFCRKIIYLEFKYFYPLVT